ncbi:MAG: hypothetical protein AAF517_26555, partial [Planctomycetota bacterium]
MSFARFSRFVLALVLPIVFLATRAANGEPTIWVIDPARSEISISIPDSEVTFGLDFYSLQYRNDLGQNEGPWDFGNFTSLSGTIFADYVEGESISFASGSHAIEGGVTSDYRPDDSVFDPALVDNLNESGQYNGTSTAPGVFGARVRITSDSETVDAAFQKFEDVEFDVGSEGPLPITDGSFASEDLEVGLSSMTLDVDGLETGLPVRQLFSDQLNGFQPQASMPNRATGGTISGQELTLPVEFDIRLSQGGLSVSGTVSGQIVATLQQSSTTVDHIDRGSYQVTDSVNGFFKTPSGSYQARALNNAGTPIDFNHSYFVFDLSGVEGTVTSATFRIHGGEEAYQSSALYEILELYSVETSPEDLLAGD